MAGKKDNTNTTFVPISITYSDGRTVPQAPDDANLASDEIQSEMDLKWRIALGELLKHELAPAHDKREYILDKYPEGYAIRVFQSQGKASKDGDKKPAPKRHTYAVGHPYGPAAKFRTPAEFALHLLWLLSPSEDRKECPCDWCDKILTREVESRNAAIAVGTGGPLASSAAGAASSAGSGSQLGAPSRASLSGPSSSTAGSGSGGGSCTVPVTTAIMSTSLPPTFPSTVFRQGEMIWFKHQAWRLGIIAFIDHPTNPSGAFDADEESNSRFTVLQLNHAALKSPPVAKTAGEMRPFLTFSVPPTTDAALANRSFDEVDWALPIAQAQQDPATYAQRSQVLGLEASKMAARKINYTYSLFNRDGTTAAPPPQVQVSYGGVFLGAEQVRVGDALRLATKHATPGDNGVEVMRVERIYDDADGGGLGFAGNVYRLATSPSGGNTPTTTSNILQDTQSRLGSAFADEVHYRNALADRFGGGVAPLPYQWQWVEQNATRREADVSGRFYPTSRLLRVIDPAGFEQALAKGEAMDANAVLNSRMGSGGGPYVGRRATRAAAVGHAVAVQLRFVDGTIREDV